ncbi:MAG: 4-alpha-glucanotransferase [Candidatus Deferrimicrobiaceae bacterium]
MTAAGGKTGGTGPLGRLARAYGVQSAYYDIAHKRVTVSPRTILAVLRALGAPLEKAEDARDALREHEQARWRRPCDPVVVVWDGGTGELPVRLPHTVSDARIGFHLRLEDGSVRELPCDLSRLPAAQEKDVEGERYVMKTIGLPGKLPWGYHNLTVETRGKTSETLVLSAPRKAYRPGEGAEEKAWGVFLPLYALTSQRSLGSGDLTDLASLMEWVSGMGGNVVGTLPLLAAFLSEPFNPSPYAPASRLFWNEFYLDVTRVPEFAACAPARELFSSPGFRAEIAFLRTGPLVDYRRGMALKRKVIEELALSFFSGNDPARRDAFREFLADNPEAEEYASFRATGERQRAPWAAWPQPLKDGAITPEAYDEKAKRYHLYAQWVVGEQFHAMSKRFRERGESLYLDLPLGVSYDSYDVWRQRDLFVLDVSAGAPPDDFFTQGQDWGFPPLHPVRSREEGFRYFRECLRHQFRHAGILRIDHVMGLHRFFCVPKGMTAREGTYVRYPAEEMYAILSLESHRHGVRLVGEDLGTVPSYVRPAMARHGLSRMSVVQFGLSPDPARALNAVPAGSLGCMNTHDMPSFASFWEGQGIDDRLALGLLDENGSREERKMRSRVKRALAVFLRRQGWLERSEAGAEEVLAACLSFLAGSRAGVVIINLEDLYLETNPQNVPGTSKERPNWLRKARHGFEEIREMPQVIRILREVDRLRKGKKNRPAYPAGQERKPIREEVG